MKIIKPLYGVLEAGNHWFHIYHQHYLNKLHISESTYDPCLLHTNENGFGVVGLQTDDTFFLANQVFTNAEELELKQTNFSAKKREKLTITTPIKFNGG